MSKFPGGTKRTNEWQHFLPSVGSKHLKAAFDNMQKLIGLAVIAFGLYLGYGVYFYYNQYSRSDSMKSHMEFELSQSGNYAGANYYRQSQHGPSWGKMALCGLGALVCIGVGFGLTAAPEQPRR
jgi:hypothetical protein